MTAVRQSVFPSLYQINTRIWLDELARDLGRPATLADVPERTLDHLAGLGFEWVWLLGVWQTGPEGQAVSRGHPDWLRDFQTSLADFTAADVCGSPFAVRKHAVHVDFGGNDSLLQLRRRLEERGLRLLLDFVPNHTALDHPWVSDWPDFYIQGDAGDLAREPHNYRQVMTPKGPLVIAHGRDPYFPGWPDTFQLNYRHPVLREAMMEELATIARLCDGVRCDMAMLLLPEVIARTWGDKSLPRDQHAPVDACFWPEAIARVRRHHADFLFMAEVYWDLEWALQQLGFDYTYDKRLYDRLCHQDSRGVRDHLRADAEFQRKSVRFLENHDEPRAAAAFAPRMHEAAAVLAYFVPGLRFFHEGQLEGRRHRANLHLNRRPAEPGDATVQDFYTRLLAALRRDEVRNGCWQQLCCRSAWQDNPTWERFLAYTWEEAQSSGARLLLVVNYGPTHGQCYVNLPSADLAGKKFLFRDLLSPAVYDRDGTDLSQRGFYLDMPAWGHHVFAMTEK